MNQTLQQKIEKLRPKLLEHAAALVLAHGKDTARRIIIRTHNDSSDVVVKAKCQYGLRLIAGLED
jgi:hypothetical protein